jgi:hypothetical protein
VLCKNGLVDGVEVVDNASLEIALRAVFYSWVTTLDSLQSSGTRSDVVLVDDMQLVVKLVEKHV